MSSLSGTNGAKRGAFIAKLVAMLGDPTLGHLIRWSNDGRAFVVFHSEEFAQKALSNYFRHRNFSSFVRQMHLYGFKKISIQNGAIQFSHADFIRGREDLLHRISRKPGVRSRQQSGGVKKEEMMSESDFALQNDPFVAGGVAGDLTTITSLRSQLEELREQNVRLAQANEDLQKQVHHLQGNGGSFGFGEDLDSSMDMKLDWNDDSPMSGLISSFVPVYPVLPKLEDLNSNRGDVSPRSLSRNYGLIGQDYMMADHNMLGEGSSQPFEYNDMNAFGFQDELGFGF